MNAMPDGRPSQGTYFLGRYRVVDEIGVGGMASVHLARMDGPGGFQKWVAIKKIHAHLVEDESFVQMFLDEARVAARISHPNVATVFDLGKHDDTYWIAMEYLHGEPLREVMRRTEETGTVMPPEIACRVIADAAEGLHAAHELLGKNGERLELVHRDVTPHNLFVTYDGVTKVVDFGIAKFSSRMSSTRAGTLKGKLAYMSPEQVHGEQIDRRTDLFALGVVLWELTTGQRLFRSESDLDTLAKVQECNVPRPSTIVHGYPIDLEKIVMRALAKNRNERFVSAREFSRALQSLLMRRGLFIASDEVASYTRSLFIDRIKRRDEHLRWAAEVTQTINVAALPSSVRAPYDDQSNVHDAGKPPKPLPAAGLPPGNASSSVDPPTIGPMRSPAAPGAPRPAAGIPAAPLIARAPSAPSRGAPLSLPSKSPWGDASGRDDEAHPADGDGPTIQASPHMVGDDDTSPAEAESATMSRPETPKLYADDEDEDGDQDTVVAAAENAFGLMPRPSSGPRFPSTSRAPAAPTRQTQLQGSFEGGAPRNDAPLPAVVVGANRDTNPPNGPFASTLAIASGTPRPSGRSFPPTPPPPAPSNPMLLGEPAMPFSPSFSDFVAPSPPIEAQFPIDHAIAPGPAPMAPSGGHFAYNHGSDPGLSGSNRHLPTVPGGRPSQDLNGSFMSRRRPPMWVVAAVSCSVALLVAGVFAVLLSSSGSPKKPGLRPTVAGPPFSQARVEFAATVKPGPAATAPAPVPNIVVVTTTTPQPPASESAAPPAPVAAPVAPAVPTSQPVAAADPPRPAPQPAQAAPAPAPKPTAVAPVPAPATGGVGGLTVVCLPQCSQVTLDGQNIGPSPIFARPVAPGRHTVTLIGKDGVMRKTESVQIKLNETFEMRRPMS